jgi:hypothetical protein
MQRKRRNSVRGFGFSNEKFLELLSSTVGISPSGVLGRETPLDLSSLEAARGTLLLRELFSKYDDGKPSEEKDVTTWKRFHEAEDLCRDSNWQIPRTFRYSPFWRAVVMRIQGALGCFSWDETSRGFGFGPGASTRLTRAKSAAAYKYSGIPESTSGNAVLASCAIRMIPMWSSNIAQLTGEASGPYVKTVPGNSVITVPKNYKTHRTIAKEPCMNMYVQKGIGQCIRRRLKRVGIDLDDQTRNQEAARKGSLTNQLATIDLSMASDTVSRELVEFLLPNDWWLAIEQSRSPVGVLPDGTILKYQKISSMGNGFTFELETLIFWAICQCVCQTDIEEVDPRVLVYGDDIVVPADKAETVLLRLFQAGFKPNTSKTYTTGPYRESCGKHYFLGCDITPFYVRKPVEVLHRLFLVHNNLFRWSERTGIDVTSVLTKLKDLAPARWRRPRLPDEFGDGAFIGALDELRFDSHPYGWQCWIAEALAVSQQQLADDLPDGQLIWALTHLSSLEKRALGLIFPDFKVRGVSAEDLYELESGLPIKEGKYAEVVLCIPRCAPEKENPFS